MKRAAFALLALSLVLAPAFAQDKDSVFETYLVAMDFWGSFGDGPYWSAGAMFSWLSANAPFVFAEVAWLYMGTPEYGMAKSRGIGARLNVFFADPFDDGLFLGPDVGLYFHSTGWEDTWDGVDSDWAYTGTSLEAQLRLGVRFLSLFASSDDYVTAYWRASYVGCLIVGYGRTLDTRTDGSTTVVATDYDATSLGFLISMEFVGYAIAFRLGLGYYRGFLLEFTAGLGWTF